MPEAHGTGCAAQYYSSLINSVVDPNRIICECQIMSWPHIGLLMSSLVIRTQLHNPETENRFLNSTSIPYLRFNQRYPGKVFHFREIDSVAVLHIGELLYSVLTRSDRGGSTESCWNRLTDAAGVLDVWREKHRELVGVSAKQKVTEKGIFSIRFITLSYLVVFTALACVYIPC